MYINFKEYVINKTPTITPNSTLFHIFNDTEKLIIKIRYSSKSDVIDIFDLEYITSLIVKKLNIDFIQGIEDIIILTAEEIFDIFDYKIPEGSYQAAIIKEINHISLHKLKKNIFESNYHFAFLKLIEQLIKFGWDYGFVHNDLHTGNIIYDLDHDKFIVIDLGRCYFYNYHLFTPEELSNIYRKINNEEKEIPDLQSYYGLIKHQLTYHVRTVESKYYHKVYLFIMFDIIGLLFYLNYFEIPDDLHFEFNELKCCRLTAETLCTLWIYAFILSLDDYYKSLYNINDIVYEKWYMTLPIDNHNHTDSRFIKIFYKKIKCIKTSYSKDLFKFIE
jgi:hypothetical protein